MAKNITLAGASYTGVPYVYLPVTGGGEAKFVDENDITYDTPSITVSSAGLITASANGKNNTKQLTTKAAATITPSASAQTIAAGTYLTGTQTIAAVPTETKDITTNGTYTPTTGKFFSSVTVNVSGGGGKATQAYIGYQQIAATSYTATNVKLTVSKTGTYKISWMGWRSTNSGTSGSQLYINNTAYGSAQTTFLNTYGQSVTLNNVSLTAGQEIVVRARSRSTSYYMIVGNLIIQEV